MPKSHAPKQLSGDAPKLERKKKSSLDYPHLAQKLIEASGVGLSSKPPEPLPAGLYIVATPIGHRGDITMRALITLAQADMIACEDTRTSGSLLSSYGIPHKKLISYHDHNEDERKLEIIRYIEKGLAVALISDAGMPLIADPGYRLVHACRAQGLNVTVIPGANAAITAMAGSGLPTDHFYFAGFLPGKSMARKKTLTSLAQIPATLIFYEAPQRLAASLHDMAEIFGDKREAVVARELTKLFEETQRGTFLELAAHYDAGDVKGEIVILVAPADTTHAAMFDLDALLQEQMKELSLRDAVATVCDMTGLKKSDVYARALQLSKHQ